MFLKANALSLPFKDRYFRLTVGSPPYCDCRSYGIKATYKVEEWIEFMLAATREALRVTDGLVVWVAAGPTRRKCYWPACEGFMYRAWKEGLHLWRPACWYKVDDNNGGTGIPGSGGPQGLRSDWEYCMIFKHPGKLPYANPRVHGHPPKYPPGGRMRNRQQSGRRELQAYTNPKLTNPGNVIKARVGGGHMGDKECHQNEAPYPERLAAWWIEAYSAPGDRVLDPFSGSGTTVVEAIRLGRAGVGTDLRMSQVYLGRERLTRRKRTGGEVHAVVRRDAKIPGAVCG